MLSAIFISDWLAMIFMLLNILGFINYFFGDEDNKVKYDKIFKFIEPLGALYGVVYLVFLSILGLFFVAFDGFKLSIFTTLIIMFLIINWLGVISYIILRFFPIKKINSIIIKWSSYELLATIIVNIVFTIIIVVTTFSFSLGAFLPLSASILYFKTLLIAKDKF